ncbi:MAG: glycosyltransferase family 4 protein [Anaerolineae bacterium]|nr:glycosyltransferase family 4 protein [Anaerolineae bacterium]
MRVHQIMPELLYGDAIGNQALKLRGLLREWGYESEIYALHRDRRLAYAGRDVRSYRGSAETLLIYHYSISSVLTDFVKQLPDRVVVYYHNVTPAAYLNGYNPGLAALLRRGREELSKLSGASYALAASPYNSEEMTSLGFPDVSVLPYFVYFDELQASAVNAAGREIVARYGSPEWVNLLFVGRIVPNKRQDDLIRLFSYYHCLINPRSRLFLVGSDANAPGYKMELEILVEALGLSDAVHFVGPVGLREGLGGYFKAASVFVCMSEHEGFCVPLLEAMAFEKPVLAFKAAGVPSTLGQAGLMVTQKRYDVLGELLELLVTDRALRQSVVSQQKRRLADFSPNRVTNTFHDFLDSAIR